MQSLSEREQDRESAASLDVGISRGASTRVIARQFTEFSVETAESTVSATDSDGGNHSQQPRQAGRTTSREPRRAPDDRHPRPRRTPARTHIARSPPRECHTTSHRASGSPHARTAPKAVPWVHRAHRRLCRGTPRSDGTAASRHAQPDPPPPTFNRRPRGPARAFRRRPGGFRTPRRAHSPRGAAARRAAHCSYRMGTAGSNIAMTATGARCLPRSRQARHRAGSPPITRRLCRHGARPNAVARHADEHHDRTRSGSTVIRADHVSSRKMS